MMKLGTYDRGANARLVTMGDFRVWFSYSTPIAFADGRRTVCRENEWGPTTGRHLRAVDAGTVLDGPTFEAALADALATAAGRGELFCRESHDGNVP